MRRGNWNRVSTMMLSLVLLIVVMGCSDDSGTDPGEPQEEVLGLWYLSTEAGLSPRIEYLTDLADTLEVYGLNTEAVEGQDFRLGYAESEDDQGEPILVYRDWIRRQSVNQAGFLDGRNKVEVAATGIVLTTAGGIDEAALINEIQGSWTWLDTLLTEGGFGEVFIYPNGIHDRLAMETSRDAGYIAAQGSAISYRPWGAFLLGIPDDEAWDDNWAQVSLYELPQNINVGDVQDLEPANIEAWLAEEEQLPTWKEQHTWVHMKTKTDDPTETGTPIIDAQHLGPFLDALIADGDVWIAPVGEIAQWVRDHHTAEQGNLVWTAGDGGAQPWNGHASALSFTTIQGFQSNLDAFAPVFTARGLSYTAFLNKSAIDAGDTGYAVYMSSEGVRELALEGVEIGSMGLHSVDMVSDQALSIDDPDDVGFHIEVFVDEGYNMLRLSQIQ